MRSISKGGLVVSGLLVLSVIIWVQRGQRAAIATRLQALQTARGNAASRTDYGIAASQLDDLELVDTQLWAAAGRLTPPPRHHGTDLNGHVAAVAGIPANQRQYLSDLVRQPSGDTNDGYNELREAMKVAAKKHQLERFARRAKLTDTQLEQLIKGVEEHRKRQQEVLTEVHSGSMTAAHAARALDGSRRQWKEHVRVVLNDEQRQQFALMKKKRRR